MTAAGKAVTNIYQAALFCRNLGVLLTSEKNVASAVALAQLMPSEVHIHSVRRRRLRMRLRRVLLVALTSIVVPLVALTIIVVLLIGPRVLSYLDQYLDQSKFTAAEAQIQTFTSALDRFHRDVGRYPSTSEGLGALITPVTGLPEWHGPYLQGDKAPKDPWGRPYVYRFLPRSPPEQGTYEIITGGGYRSSPRIHHDPPGNSREVRMGNGRNRSHASIFF